MSNEEEKKYCVTIRIPEIDIMIIMPMNEDHLNLVANAQDRINWIFSPACQVMIDKSLLKHFSVELVQ